MSVDKYPCITQVFSVTANKNMLIDMKLQWTSICESPNNSASHENKTFKTVCIYSFHDNPGKSK